MSTGTATHPKGLYVLFATEMWERFNFYGMRALLVLFLVNALQFLDKQASLVYGAFLGLCYLTPMLGGFISDRFLGNRRCILLGGTIMACGQLLLFASGSLYSSDLVTATRIMWLALLLLIFGNGLFKPNISSMVGQLYPKGDSRLDSAFTVFYMGINVGAFLGLTICPLLGDIKLNEVRVVEAFRWGFLAAAIAMSLSVIFFYFLMDKYIVTPDGKPVGVKPSVAAASDAQEGRATFSRTSLMIGGIVWLILITVFYFIQRDKADDGSAQLDLAALIFSFIYATGLTLAGLILTDKSLTLIERHRIITLYFVAFFVMFFWGCFEQAGSSLTFVADYQTDTRIFGWDMPPSLVQNANAFFIIVFAPIFSVLWLWLQSKKLEPISPAKQAIGLALLAAGFLLIAFRVNGMGLNDKMGVGWLVGMYLFHTLGELCLSPVGLSLVSKLAPVRFSSLLMGVWFLANAGGYALAGTLGALLPPTGDKFKKAASLGFDLQGVLDKTVDLTQAQIQTCIQNNIPIKYPVFAGITLHNLYEFFMVLVILPGGAAIVLLMVCPLLKKLMHGVR
jgi:proton-dependent oligopeptide transporter, POT family